MWLNVVVGIFIVWAHLSTYVHALITLRRAVYCKKVARQSADNFWAPVYFAQQKYILPNKSGQMPRSTGVHAVAGTLYDHFIRFATQHHESFPCYMVFCALGWEEIFRVSGMVWSGEGGFTFGFGHLNAVKNHFLYTWQFSHENEQTAPTRWSWSKPTLLTSLLQKLI